MGFRRTFTSLTWKTHYICTRSGSIIYVLAEPRRFLAILLMETGWDQKKTAVFPPYLKVVVASFICVVERLAEHMFWELSFIIVYFFYNFSYVMCTERFLMVYHYLYVLEVLTSLWRTCCISLLTPELSPTIAPGQCILSFESAFLAVTANYFILRCSITKI